jgi:hypothetical protein
MPSSALALDAVAADLLVQVRSLDAEHDGGAAHVPFEGAQRVDDVVALGELPVLAERRARPRRERREVDALEGRVVELVFLR